MVEEGTHVTHASRREIKIVSSIYGFYRTADQNYNTKYNTIIFAVSSITSVRLDY
jgi:hypothetical protein